MTGLPSAARFIVKWIVVGLAAAFLLVLLRPQWLLRTGTAQVQSAQVVPPLSFADAVARTAPAVVNIFTARVIEQRATPGTSNGDASPRAPTPEAGRGGLETGLGSGVIVDAEGHVITNNHVVACAEEIYVQLADGRIDRAIVVGTDPATDIALLQIKLDKLPMAPLGQSDALRTGDVVLAIGAPYGLSQTVTQGIVSALGRGQLNVAAIEGFIQTDAAINEGNSGGALINVQGDLIGINTAALAQNQGISGISFAIPVNLVRGVLQAIMRDGRVKRGWFGVESAGLTAQQATILGIPVINGLFIKKVYPNSPAAAAGLQPGDIITHIDGAQRTMSEALSLVASKQPGEKISLSVIRDSTRRDFTVKLVERQAAEDERHPCTTMNSH